MPELRRLAWPAPARVDLARDFRWLAHAEDSEAQPLQPALACSEEAAGASGARIGHSPYARALRKPPAPRAPLSPAQRAAKKMIKLRLELELETGGSESEDARAQEIEGGERGGACEATAQVAGRRTSAGGKRNARVNATPSKKKVEELPVHSKRVGKPQSSSPTRMSPTAIAPSNATRTSQNPPLSPVSKAKKRPESKDQRALRELRDKQRRLADWIAADITQSHRKRKKGDADDHPPHVAYSIEVEARIHDAMVATRDRGLWGDQVASLIASEMTSEAVFGGFIGTRRLALPVSTSSSASSPPITSSDLRLDREKVNPTASTQLSVDMGSLSATELQRTEEQVREQKEIGRDAPVLETDTSSLIHERALEIREEAQSLVRAGNVEDALTIIQDGINQLLFDFHDNQDEIQRHGFNYSQDAHDKVTRVQLKYRARHRERVSKCVVLQRMWRRYQARKAFTDTKQFNAANAVVIQRYYKARFQRIRRHTAAVRIQTCFRTFQLQKLLIFWRRAYRLLLENVQRQREMQRQRRERFKRIWAKVGADLAIRSLWRSRFHAIVCIQSHWRGLHARNSYAVLLEECVAAEQVRRSREDHFVQSRIDEAMASYHRFLTNTRIGNEVVRWQMNKRWIRYKRLRADDWQGRDLESKVQALCGIQRRHQQPYTISALQLRTFGHLLGIDSQNVQQIQTPMHNASFDGMCALFKSCSAPNDSAKDATAVLSTPSKQSRVSMWFHKSTKRLRQWWEGSMQALNKALLLVYWHVVLFPLSFLFVRKSLSNRQSALDILEAQQRFVLVKYLRRTYRLISSSDTRAKATLPSLMCRYCAEAFVTASTYSTHMRSCRQQYHEQYVEWIEIGRDLTFLKQTSWRSRKMPPLPNDPQVFLDFTAITLDSLVEEMAKSHPQYKHSQHHHQHQQWCWQQRWQQCRLKRCWGWLGLSWWQSSDHERALQSLLDVATRCSSECSSISGFEVTDSNVGDKLQGMALELVAYLLLALRRAERVHPLALPQLHAFVDWKVPAKRSIDRGPLWTDEQGLLVRFLGTRSESLSSSNTTVKLNAFGAVVGATALRVVDIATEHVGSWWRHAKTWWCASSTASSKYRPKAKGPSATVLPVS